jgi:hypothetical protein
MSSTFALSLHDHDHDHNHNLNRDPSLNKESYIAPSASATPNGCDSVSPAAHNQLGTPAASTLSYYHTSDVSDFEEDPFFGADLSSADPAAPSFLDDGPWNTSSLTTNQFAHVEPRRNAADPSYPLTPEQTASIHTSSPRSDRRATLSRQLPGRLPASISPQELQKPFQPEPVIINQASQLTPDQSSSGRSSEDGLAPPFAAMHPHSPRVTVSVWDRDGELPSHTVERSFAETSPTLRGGIDVAGDLITLSESARQPRDDTANWESGSAAGRTGLDPHQRPSDEIPSINDLADQQQTQERNNEVDRWLSGNLNEQSIPSEPSQQELQAVVEKARTESDSSIPLGDNTENRYVPGQTYFSPTGGPLNDKDAQIIAENRTWGDAPTLYEIRQSHPGRHQPETSQQAIARFERMCRDNDSIISRSATWGTRRRSFPDGFDMENITSGNLLKKLHIGKPTEKNQKSGSFMKELRGFVRRPSISSLRKRRNSAIGTELEQQQTEPEDESAQAKRDSISSPLLAPPDQASLYGKKTKPSLNTALASMANSFAAIGSTASANHARKTSISGGSITSPRSSLSFKAKNPLQRQRSKSDLAKPTGTPDSASESHSNLVEMWKMSGGPPGASLSKQMMEVEEDDDDDDDMYEDNDMKAEANLIDEITPNFAGFQQHILMLNPDLRGNSNYLVERIAHQQIVRYKALLNLKVRHLGMGANCPCGQLCVAMGGQANVLDQKGDAKGLDPLSTQLDDDDETGTPTEGAINQDSFPTDIPMPPTQYLPAEFECQLCFQRKKFQKPSDWTKHVHEDIQPFTCTWDRCRDAKSFKRKADWVRHENEGHRHLEWWTCDVDECRHTCYRRDNFLQHLVREHKFPEPKVKTKAAIKKAGGLDATWQKVERCHILTDTRPQQEPCRFCGKVFPTWKKLTVHLAKHMEQISLPVLRLVAAKAQELAADTIISPVQDPPPRSMIPQTLSQEHMMGPYAASTGQLHPGQQQAMYQQQHQQHQGPYMYSNLSPGHLQQPQFFGQYDSLGQTLQQPPVSIGGMNPGYGQHGQMQGLPVTTAPYDHGTNQYLAMPNNSHDNGLEPFPTLDGLGLHNGAGAPMHAGYTNMMDGSTRNPSPFSGHGTVSPYSHSPHLNAGQSDQSWDDRQPSGYL